MSLPRGVPRNSGVAVPFPVDQPPGYTWLDDEPTFDPNVHLALETPRRALSLAELGYTEHEVARTASPVAVSKPFRVLSDEGAAVLLETSRRLLSFATPAGERIERVVRGGCYRSRWLRELALSPDVADAMSSVMEASLAPHAMPVHLAHLNYQPTELGRAVDKWHHDTLAIDYVMMVTDPQTVAGGRFEYFVGTKAEAAALAAEGQLPPPERVVAPEFGGAGWAIALHGNMVVHRGAPLTEAGERITMVNGYVTLDTSRDDQSRSRDLIGVDDPSVLYAEWARHVAWRAEHRLRSLQHELQFGEQPDVVVARLRRAIEDVSQAMEEMTAGTVEAEHYERTTT